MTVTTPTPSGHAVRGLTRRGLLARALTAGASLVVGTGFVAARDAAWAVETVALKPESMAVLIQMARDIYPHDRIPDRHYALAVKPHDDPEQAGVIEDGVAMLLTLAELEPYYDLAERKLGVTRTNDWPGLPETTISWCWKRVRRPRVMKRSRPGIWPSIRSTRTTGPLASRRVSVSRAANGVRRMRGRICSSRTGRCSPPRQPRTRP